MSHLSSLYSRFYFSFFPFSSNHIRCSIFARRWKRLDKLIRHEDWQRSRIPPSSCVCTRQITSWLGGRGKGIKYTRIPLFTAPWRCPMAPMTLSLSSSILYSTCFLRFLHSVSLSLSSMYTPPASCFVAFALLPFFFCELVLMHVSWNFVWSRNLWKVLSIFFFFPKVNLNHTVKLMNKNKDWTIPTFTSSRNLFSKAVPRKH